LKTTLATRTEIDLKRVALDVVRTALESHRLRSHATAHVPPHAIDDDGFGGALAYQDSAGTLVAETLLEIEIEGQTLYVPCQIFAGEAPTGDPD